MKHSIVIPFLDRNKGWTQYLNVCVWAIDRSAKLCGETDYEILVVDGGSTVQREKQSPHERLLPMQCDTFNKCFLLNVGVDCAVGGVLTLLDADAIVGPEFMRNIDTLLSDTELTKLCYRVKYLPPGYNETLFVADRELVVSEAFANYHAFQRAAEAYGRPHFLKREGGHPVFGNSQFSIRRDVLGDLRWDESYAGGRMEDVEMNRRIADRYGDRYRAEIVTNPCGAILMTTHPQIPHWCSKTQTDANNRRYMRHYREERQR